MRLVLLPTLLFISLAMAPAGCAEPFAAQETRLSAPRILAIEAVADTTESLTLTAWVYGGDPYTAPEVLSYHWFTFEGASPDALADLQDVSPSAVLDLPGGASLGTDPFLLNLDPDLLALDESGAPFLALAVSSPQHKLRGFIQGDALSNTQGPSPVDGISAQRIPELSTFEEDGQLAQHLLSAEHREHVATTPAPAYVAPGSALRLEAKASPLSQGIHWYQVETPQDPLILLPLDETHLDILTVTTDEGDDGFIQTSPLSAGNFFLVGVAQNETARNGVTLWELALGAPPSPPESLSRPLAMRGEGLLIWVDAADDDALLALQTTGPQQVEGVLEMSEGETPHLLEARPTDEDDASPCLRSQPTGPSVSLQRVFFGQCTLDSQSPVQMRLNLSPASQEGVSP